ncbi:MAG TPA: amidohydrolase family protein [Kofleriaceae bacterium]|nr:amidohydrolase family protein [Kofleriaceae bacterium]
MQSLAVAILVVAACDREDPARSAATAPARRLIDVHTHIDPDAIERAVALFDRRGIAVAVNLSGGAPGAGLEEQLAAAARFPGRIIVFASPSWSLARTGPGYGERMAAELAHAHSLGARGLKISKGLGLGYTDWTGAAIAVDAPELDPLFDRAGQLGMPVAIHTGDPIAFWRPPGPGNERRAELAAHPGWSLHDRPVPSWGELQLALERRIARHPRTTFISVHFGNAPERPRRVAALLDRYPNLYIDTAARIPEIGRHATGEMRELFLRHQHRILFGSDLGIGTEPGDLMLGSSGSEPPKAADVNLFFDATWRYFETADRDFPHPTPIQGSWRISGVELPPSALDRIYWKNAAQLLDIPQP